MVLASYLSVICGEKPNLNHRQCKWELDKGYLHNSGAIEQNQHYWRPRFSSKAYRGWPTPLFRLKTLYLIAGEIDSRSLFLFAFKQPIF